MVFLEVVTVLAALLIGVWGYYQRSFSYWKKRRVPQLDPKFPFGTSGNPFNHRENIGCRLRDQYLQLKSMGYKHAGLYSLLSPVYLPIHPEYVKNIMSKDFNHFMDRGTYYDEQKDPISAHLFNMEGQKWKNLRMKLTAAFTSGKIKTMFPTLIECGNQMKEYLEEMRTEPIDIKNVLERFSVDVIGSCAFGIECNSFKNADSEFTKQGKKIFGPFNKLQTVRNIIAFATPNLARFLGIVLTDAECAHFFMQTVKNTLDYREKTQFVRKDFMQILLDLKNSTNDEEKLTVEQIAAQAFVFFSAGFESSSTTMTFCLFELAQNQAIQDRIRKEINEVLKEEDVTYETLSEMKYLAQVIDETLRKYPPLPLTFRVCTKNYKVPDTDVVIEKDTKVLVPVMGLQHDPEFFPDPDLFNPDRFNEENKNKINSFTYMPFGEGPRICIGLRFGLMETKFGLVTLLKNFKFKLNSCTALPLKTNPYSFVLTPKDSIWLDVEAINRS